MHRIGRFRSVVLSAVIFVSAVAVQGASAWALPDQEETWSVMIYMDGDNDLEQNCLDDMLELESVGWADAINIVVMMDTMTYFEGVHWYTIDGSIHNLDPDSGTYSCDCEELCGACPGERNMGNAAALESFVEQAVVIAPADYYMLVLWNHGASWFGVCEDWSSPLLDGRPDCLTMQEIETAISEADIGDLVFDIIAFDACLMGAVEVAYELRNSASYMVGAITAVPGVGLPYDLLIDMMQNSADRSPENVGRMIVDSYIDFLGECSGRGVGGYPYAAMSMIDLDLIDEFVLGVDAHPGGIDDLGQFLLDACAGGNPKGFVEPLESKTPQIQYLGEQDPFIDIGLFAEALASFVPEAANLVSCTIELLSDAVVYHRYVTNEMEACLKTHGLSIYFTVSEHWLLDCYAYEHPVDEEEQHYGLDLPRDTCWDEFLFSLSRAA